VSDQEPTTSGAEKRDGESPQAGVNPAGGINVSAEVIDAIERELDAQAKLPPPEEPVKGKVRMVRPDVASKGLVLLWCLWLMGSWMIISQHDTSFASFRWMMMAIMIGLVILWPMYRLSQAHPEKDPEPEPVKKKPFIYFGTFESGYPMRPGVVLSDWLCLNLVLQALIWPLYLGPRWGQIFAQVQGQEAPVDVETRWSVQQTMWMGLDVAAWSLLAGCLIVLGCRAKSSRGRVLAMVGAMGLVLGEPLVMWVMNLISPVWVGWPMVMTPIRSFWEISGQPQDWNGRYWVPILQVTVRVGGGAWGGVWAWVWLSRRTAMER
jgi:xanthosine utilization system XapX-like protein